MRNGLVHFRSLARHLSLCSYVYNAVSRCLRIAFYPDIEFVNHGQAARLPPRKCGAQPRLINSAKVRSSLATLALAFASMAQ